MSAFTQSSRWGSRAEQTDEDWWTVSRKKPTTSKDKACYQCGGPHLARDCTTPNESSKKCYRCGGNHLARNCSLPYKSDGFSGGGARLGRGRKEAKNDLGLKPGDWMCPSCGDHQFARNATCRLCGEVKPEEKCSDSIRKRPEIKSSSTEEDSEIASKTESPVALPKQALPKQDLASDVAGADSVKSCEAPSGGKTPCKSPSGGPVRGQSWADIVDEEEEQQAASTSAGNSDVGDSPSEDSGQVEEPLSKDGVLSGDESTMALAPDCQQFWQDPMTWSAGNGLTNDPGNFNEAMEANGADPMNQMMMCGSQWPGMWWPNPCEQAILQPMQLTQRCPNGHELTDGVVTALDNYICDGCGSKVATDEHVMECSACNWGLCRRFCCAKVLNAGDRVKSLCAEPSWNPKALEIGDEGVIVENLFDGRVTVDFNGVSGWLYASNLEILEA